MKFFRKQSVLVMVITALTISPDVASANDVYIAENGAGSGNGSSPENPCSYSYFNMAGNWTQGTPTGIQIGPGTTVHLCGAFTGAANGNLLTVQGSGAPRNPVTVRFDTGAKLSSPVWSGTKGAINLNGRSWIVVDGGRDGIIQNTANGTGLANQATSVGVLAAGTTNCEIKNLSIVNLYVRTSHTDQVVDQTNTNAIKYYPPATNLTIDHNTIHDVGWALNGYGNGLRIYGNDIGNMDHGVAVGVNSGAYSGVSIHDNHIHDMTKWDTAAGLPGGGPYHHDGIHVWGQTGGAVADVSIYQNRFDGDSGLNNTAWIFIESLVSNISVYDNTFEVAAGRIMNTGSLSIWGKESRPSGVSIHNNTVLDNNPLIGGATSFGVQNHTNVSFENNVAVGSNTAISFQNCVVTECDYNSYDDSGARSGNTFGWNGRNTSNLAVWQSEVRGDQHSKLIPASAARKMREAERAIPSVTAKE